MLKGAPPNKIRSKPKHFREGVRRHFNFPKVDNLKAFFLCVRYVSRKVIFSCIRIFSKEMLALRMTYDSTLSLNQEEFSNDL